jgi:hypothetical protein
MIAQFSGTRVAVLGGHYNLRLSELVDYTQGAAKEEILRSRCDAIDRVCRQLVENEVLTTVQQYEAQARASFGMLRDLLVRLQAVPGRKIVVLTSQGVPVADRPGGRPDVSDAVIEVGKAAAEANAMIYCLYVDQTVTGRYGAEQRSNIKISKDLERDSDVSMLSLSLMAGAAGGSVNKVLVGEGDVAYAKIIRETSAFYLVHVAASDADRTGRPLPIQVKTTRSRVQVMSRSWVTIPAR